MERLKIFDRAKAHLPAKPKFDVLEYGPLITDGVFRRENYSVRSMKRTAAYPREGDRSEFYLFTETVVEDRRQRTTTQEIVLEHARVVDGKFKERSITDRNGVLEAKGFGESLSEKDIAREVDSLLQDFLACARFEVVVQENNRAIRNGHL